jgi:hypothetical protein
MGKRRIRSSQKENLSQKRRPWTSKEDEAIKLLVRENGVKQWTLIAENLCKKFNIIGRTGKQCRERWHNHLNNGIIKQPWTQEEEFTLFTTHKLIGNKWAEISKEIPGRTDNSIKNHFYSTVRKYYRKIFGKEGTQEDLRAQLSYITDAVLQGLNEDKGGSEEKLTADSLDEEEIFPDLDDMIVTGHCIKSPSEWNYFDQYFDSDQEIFMYPYSTNDNLQFFNNYF